MIGGSARVLALGPLVATLAVASAQGIVRPGGAAVGCTPRWRSVVSAPGPYLNDIAALSPTNVWAVGWTSRGSQRSPAIVHWNGSRLEAKGAFRPQSTDAELDGVAAVSTNDVWAVGSDGNRPVVEHWDGVRWRVVGIPHLKRAGWLSDIVALSPTNAWAVGGSPGARVLIVLVHWDGHAWDVVATRREGALSAVGGAVGAGVWAVGTQGFYGSVNNESPLAIHWNGRHWQEFPAVMRADTDLGYEDSNDLAGIDVVSATEAWATHNSVVRADIQRWDGHRWAMKHVFPQKSQLLDVAALSRNDVWAVGLRGSYESPHPLIVHWNGRFWRAQDEPLSRLRATLSSLSALSPSEIWAAGGWGSSLIARYSCS
jgi:hypothetical protein